MGSGMKLRLLLVLAPCFFTGCAETAAPLARHDDDARIARLERRLDQVVSILEKAMPPSEPDPAARYAVPVSPNDPQEGPRDAKITIVEGFEFLCPYCFMVNPTIDAVLAKYPHDVRVVGKYLVIHGQPAVPPAMAACAAFKQGKYKEMKSAIWTHLWGAPGDRPSLDKDEAQPDHLTRTATSAGVNATKMESDMRSRECMEWVHDSEETLRAFNAASTPSFFINGRYIAGAQSQDAFEKVIDEELAAANHSQVPAAEYYQREIVGKGLKRVKNRFDD